MVSIFEKVKAEIRTGLVSSVIAEAALFPLDAVKLQQQVNGGGALEIFRRLLSERGIFGLYKGLFGRLIQTVTSNVGFFIWQTLAVQSVTSRFGEPGKKLSTGLSLIVNMLAQQINRLLTTPVDVVANVNQSDPNAKGFLSTFVYLARTGGMPTLWRGLPVAMILAFNPALMFTMLDKLTFALKTFRNSDEPLKAQDMFWISGISKAIATVVTYPLIRAKSVQQSVSTGLGLWATLVQISQKEGRAGLYTGVWMLSYKTVLFNSLMMALKQQLTNLETRWRQTKAASATREESTSLTGWKKQVTLAASREPPWVVAARGGKVVYADGSWSFLHKAQEHLLQRACEHGQYLLVGVHSDQGHQQAVGTWPAECFAARVARLRQLPIVDALVEGAPWDVEEDMMKELGIDKVVSGSMSKLEDCSPPSSAGGPAVVLMDPYEVPRRLKCFYTIKSLNQETEHQVWMERASRILFSNVDASIDWRILVRDGAKTSWGKNPGYSGRAASPEAVGAVPGGPAHPLTTKTISAP